MLSAEILAMAHNSKSLSSKSSPSLGPTQIRKNLLMVLSLLLFNFDALFSQSWKIFHTVLQT
ncbi:hypothetical protein B0F87_11563 [Methylobacter tundripaludum]|uniref:Uncharacterized protein n=1 Tax=Methylobacter tundripaludum TaxID=173365 RepID=A0A2S6H6C1_9GAMM|nr:hypothetical protein B0F87_11563 [Methylobacter tundripaludum]